MKHRKKRTAIISILVLALLLTSSILIFKHPSEKPAQIEPVPAQFAKADKQLANGSVQLCSDYAGLCFARPATWTRSAMLNAGVAKKNNIEINPPTGTILRFEAISSDTATVCPSYATCDINTVKLMTLANGLSILSGVFDTNSSDPNVVSGHTPFVQLIGSEDIASYGLQVGRNTAYTSFNPGVSFGYAKKVLLQVSPGKGYSTEAASEWLSSSEGTAAHAILASTRSQ